MQEQIDAMLSGNLSFDTKKEGDEEDEEGRTLAVLLAGSWVLSTVVLRLLITYT